MNDIECIFKQVQICETFELCGVLEHVGHLDGIVPSLVCTVKPVLSGHRIKRTLSIKRTVAEVPKSISLIYFK